MVEGVIVRNRPVISAIISWDLSVQKHVALVDTGFTGELKISPEKADELGLKLTHTESVTLGDGHAKPARASLAYINLGGKSELVTVLIMPGETVVGVGLFQKFRFLLEMNFCTGLLMMESC